MNRQQLIEQIQAKKSFLCVGLDPDINKMPTHIQGKEDAIFEFNKAIIDATAPYCVAYKPNLAFYEAYGIKGMISFEKTIEYLHAHYPKHFIIADAKRGDIGNTSSMYAKTFFCLIFFHGHTSYFSLAELILNTIRLRIPVTTNRNTDNAPPIP